LECIAINVTGIDEPLTTVPLWT